MRIRRIVPIITGERLVESREFYTEVIGLRSEMDLGWIISLGSPTNPTAQLSVMSGDATAPVNPNITIEVGNLDVVHARALGRGSEIVHPVTAEAWGVRRFFLRDPNGTIINVMSH